MVTIRSLEAGDAECWNELWQDYLIAMGVALDPDITDTTWRRLNASTEVPYGFGALNSDGKLIGFAHYLFHRSTWVAGSYCYLEDLFVDPAARRSGAARALVLAVEKAAREQACEEMYLVTAQDNAAARTLYDQVLEKTPFIEYRTSFYGEERNATPNPRSAT